MKLKARSIIQTIATVTVIITCIIYGLYINEYIDFRILSIGDMNPYGGWSAVKSAFIDLSYRWKGFSKSIALTISIALTALLMGRFFCGYICPIGAMQDFFKYLGIKLKLKEIRFSYKPELLKYLILIVIMVFSIFEMGNIVSPYSPWLAYLNIFIGFKFQTGTVILLLIVLISLFGRRIFCRYFCPLGAFQSLLYAIGTLKIKKRNCDCSYCLRECPVSEQLRVTENEENLSPECINCLKCINTCTKNKEGYSLTFGNKSIKKSTYITISICLILGSYILLPLIGGNSTVQAITSIENINDGTYQGIGIGFGGIINVEVTINNKKITHINVLSHRETQGYYEEAFRELTYEITETQNLNLDSISGATSTCRGLLNSVKDAVNKSLAY